MNIRLLSNKLTLVAVWLLSVLISSSTIQADDIEVYLQPPSDPVYPNILFVLDESGSMGTKDVTTTVTTCKNVCVQEKDVCLQEYAMCTEVDLNNTSCKSKDKKYVCLDLDSKSDCKKWKTRRGVRYCIKWKSGKCNQVSSKKVCYKKKNACLTVGTTCKTWGTQCTKYEEQCTTQSGVKISRLQALKNAMNALLDDGAMDNANIGIMGYTTNAQYNVYINASKLSQHKVESGSSKANVYWQPRLRSLYYGTDSGFGLAKDVKAQLKTAVDGLTAYSYTPTMEAMGAAVEWFRVGFKETVDSRDSRMGSHSNVTFDSPLDPDYYCASNHIVLLTDGRPNSNNGFDYWYSSGKYYVFPKDPTVDHYPVVPGVPSPTTPNLAPYGGSACSTSDPDNPFDNGSHGGLCARELAVWAYNTDLKTDWAKQQRIFIQTIGFKTSSSHEDFLTVLASNAGGKFYPADNATDLLDAFKAIANEAGATISFTYNAPSIPFNADNAAVSGTDMYVPMLVPAAKKFWAGNIKHYRVSYNEETHVVSIKDKNGDDVLDADFNFQDTQDYWNNGQSDEADTLKGGADTHMTGSNTRKLYTYLAETHYIDLTQSTAHRVSRDNSSITSSMLGAANNAERSAILNWANWKSDDGTSNIDGLMGAPLHTKPVVVRYTGVSPAYDLVFINTTDGILHAFKSGTGEEAWAYMPDELLGQLKDAKDNIDASLPMYGLDGPMTYYEIGAHKLLVFGQRRGGRNYYALEITDRDHPKFAWEIKGGITSGFETLGQTWSKPLFTTMKIEDAAPQHVLVFGGGYDDTQDFAQPGTADSMGNAIYIVNPVNGALIKKIDSDDMVNGSMDNGIAANVLPVDINADGNIDRLYAVDVAGRVIRVDIPDAQLAAITGSNSVTGTVLANVNVSGSQQTVDAADDYQRFFNTPEVAYFNRHGETYLALLVASGHRPDPLSDAVQDRFYMFKDPNVWSAPADGSDSDSLPDYGDIIEEGDLYDATANLVQDGADGVCTDSEAANNPNGKKSCAKAQLKDAAGWYMNFETSEKGFSEAKVYDYAVFFTTYKNDTSGTSSSTDPCVASSANGSASLYVINMEDGSAMVNAVDGKFDQDSTDTLTKADRKVGLNIPGMPPSPTLLFPKSDVDGDVRLGGTVVAIVGLETVLQWPDRFHPISWEEVIEED